MKCILNGKIITEKEILTNKALVFDQNIISITCAEKVPKNATIIDAKGNYVCPGFISTHIHGCLNCGVEDGQEKSIETISNYLLCTGVTSWCPTLFTVDDFTFEKALAAVRTAKNSKTGAKIIGLYLEGIFLSKEKKGAHNQEWLKHPNHNVIIKNKDIISLVICAPELEGAQDFIENVTKEGVRVCLGHSNATYSQTVKAINAGATNITHLFNACSAITHRELGLTGAALKDNRVYTELICDNFHISPYLYDIVYTLKKDKLILITDSIRPTGMPDGEYTQCGQKVIKKGNQCRLADGTIAGSTLDLNKGIYNVLKNSNIPLTEIIKAVSLNPAKMLGKDSEIGSIKEGKVADIVIADNNFNIIKVFKNGKQV